MELGRECKRDKRTTYCVSQGIMGQKLKHTIGTSHITRNGPFKVLQLSDSVTNHSAVYSDQSQDSLF